MRREPITLLATAALLIAGFLPMASARGAGLENSWPEQLKDPSKRIEAQWNLRLEKDPSKIPALITMLRSRDSGLITTILQILSESGDEALWQSVVSFLKDPDPLVREAAAQCLGALGNRAAIPYLIEALRDGMPLPEAFTYWVLPSDITENYRYACVDALNRLAKQNFKYTRAVNNFGRMHWRAQIDKWWEQQQAFYSPVFRAQGTAWQEHKSSIEKLVAGLPKPLLEESAGGQELDARLKELKEFVEAIIRELQSPNVGVQGLEQHSGEISKTLAITDEIFVYSPELATVRPVWKELKTGLEKSLRVLNTYLHKK